jgi:hypothetical protein
MAQANPSEKKFQKMTKAIGVFASKMTQRNTIANILIASFILFVSIGTFLISPPAGFITFGVACGAVGILLGME